MKSSVSRIQVFASLSKILSQYCTNPINSSVTRHRGSEIDEILRGHRSQGPPTKPPVRAKLGLEIEFFSP